jgi:hypothetical protein
VPIIGWVPTDDMLSENSRAPHKFAVSDIPKDWTLFNLQYSLSKSILAAPSQIEYCVCILK